MDENNLLFGNSPLPQFSEVESYYKEFCYWFCFDLGKHFQGSNFRQLSILCYLPSACKNVIFHPLV